MIEGTAGTVGAFTCSSVRHTLSRDPLPIHADFLTHTLPYRPLARLMLSFILTFFATHVAFSFIIHPNRSTRHETGIKEPPPQPRSHALTHTLMHPPIHSFTHLVCNCARVASSLAHPRTPDMPMPVPRSWPCVLTNLFWSMLTPHPGEGPQSRKPSCSGERRRRRSTSCIACGSKVVAGSVGTAVSQAPAGGPACKRTSAQVLAATQARGSVGCEFATRGAANRAANNPSLCSACGEGEGR